MHVIIMFAQSPITVRHTIYGADHVFIFVKRSVFRGAALDLFPELLGEFSAPMTDRRLTVPVLAGMCDAVTVRVETVGEWVIHDILRRYEVSEP